jgi:transcriptional regulator with XRE-family HTH domain
MPDGYTEDVASFGSNVQKLRKARGMTQGQLAEKLLVGQAAVSKIENEASARPDYDTVAKYAVALEASIADLLEDTGIRYPLALPLDRKPEHPDKSSPKKIVKDRGKIADSSSAHNSAPHDQAGGSPVDDPLRDQLLRLYGAVPAELRSKFLEDVEDVFDDVRALRKGNISPKRRRPAR